MKKLDLKIFIEEYTQDELIPEDSHLLSQAKKACERAYAPYSHFQVGAAILLDNRMIIWGSNQENAAFPSGMCAERTAIFYTGANHSRNKILAIAIAARTMRNQVFLPISPCGACRQAILEYENKQAQPIRLLMQGNKENVFIASSISSLLPLQFSGENLSG